MVQPETRPNGISGNSRLTLPVPTAKILNIAASVQAVREALRVRLGYYRAAFRPSDSDALQGTTIDDFGKLESRFLRRVQSFLDTIHRRQQ